LTVITWQHAEAEVLDVVPKEMFYPPPKVDSLIVRLKPFSRSPFEVKDELFFKRMVKWLFTERNRKLGKALTPFLKTTLKLSKQDAEKLSLAVPFHERRARELSPKDFGAIANAICN
jgi:16S rRNA (adenine1518-N6/adenine1519-N6)-dimethyltransferase